MLVRSLSTIVAMISLSALALAAPVPRYRTPKVPNVTQLLKSIEGTYERINTSANVQAQRVQVQAQAPLAGNVVILRSTSTTQIRLSGDRWSYVYNRNGEERVGTTYQMKLDTSTNPMTLDLIRPETNATMLRGIVAVDKDQIRFCYVTATGRNVGKPRPKDFSQSNGQILMLLKRVAKP